MDDITDQIRAMAEAGSSQYAAPMQSASSEGGFFGALQTLGTGYLSRRIDIDLQSRVMQPGTAQLRGNQRPINETVSGNMLGEMFSGQNALLMLGAAALVLVLIFKR